jgi:hypothetical protein
MSTAGPLKCSHLLVDLAYAQDNAGEYDDTDLEEETEDP